MSAGSVMLRCPEPTALHPGFCCLYRAKIGGERQLINIRLLSAPYRRDFNDGRKALYVDAYGYGWSGTVQAGKLLIAVPVSVEAPATLDRYDSFLTG